MVEGLTLGGRIARFLWGAHYRIPEPLYWLLFAVAVATGTASALVGAGPVALVALPVVGACLLGVVRWHQDRGRCHGALVLPCFRAVHGQEARSEDIQRLMYAELLDKLTVTEAERVQTVPATLGMDERRFGVRLRRRLRARYMAYGRISEQGKSIDAGVMQPVRELIFHVDMHTRDTTVRKAP